MPVVYENLKGIARRLLETERNHHTLRTTALVHEAYLRLVGVDIQWQNRIHFYSIAARCMRRILVDHARAQKSAKRGGGSRHFALDEALVATPGTPQLVLDLDEALNRLAGQDARKSQLLELQYFAGLTYEEMAEAFQLTPKQIGRELRFARAWLRAALDRA